MSRYVWLALVMVAFVVTPCMAEVSTDLVVKVVPAALLIDIDSKDYAVDGEFGRVRGSDVYTMPNFTVGVGVELEDVYLDLTGGAGVLVNDTFRSFMLQAQLAGTFEVSPSFRLGPRVGLILFFDGEWIDDGDVDFDESLGYLVGIEASLGDKVMYFFSIDVMSVDLDGEASAGTTPSSDEYELTALAVQFGVRGEF